MTDIQEPTQSEPLPIWYWLFMLTGAALIVAVAWGVHQKGGQKSWWLGTVALLTYVSLSGSVWRVADWLRLAAMPSAFFSTGFLDTLRLRVFWAVGPQFFGLLFLSLMNAFVVVHWGRPPKGDRAGATPMPTAIAVVPTVETVPTHSGSSVSIPAHTSVFEAGDASDAAAMAKGGDQSHCDDPAVLALVRQEVWAVAAMRIKTTHGMDMGVEEIAPILEVGLQNIRQIESDNQTDTLCGAKFALYAHAEAKNLGLETEVDPDVVYWIERDASGNLQVGIGD